MLAARRAPVYQGAMSDLIIDSIELEQVLRRCAGPAVTSAITLLNRGENVDELVAVMAYMQGGLKLAVGRANKLFEKTPSLLVESVLNREHVPVGYLQWVVLLAPRGAWGAFSVASGRTAEA